MSPVLRTFLMWLLMSAIPVQGFAASAMLHCGPSHQRQQHVAHDIGGAATGGHEAHAAHHAGHPGQHAHAGHHGMSADAGDTASADSDGAGASTPLSAAKCSACAYCCHAFAIVGTPPAIGIATPDSAPEAAVPPRVEAVVPDGLDRPPRPPFV